MRKDDLDLTSESHRPNISRKKKLAYGGDWLAIRHDAPRVAEEEATSVEKARGEAQDLL